MNLSDMQVSYVDNEVKLTVQVDSEKKGRSDLWFSLNKEYEPFILADQYDPFMVAILYSAMRYKENIHIEGKVSKKLIYNINHYVIPLIQSYSPETSMIRVTAEEETTENYKGDGIGTGFSGGIDSFHTVYRHYELENDPDYKINSFLFLNVGAHGYDGDEMTQDKFENRYEYLKQFPEEVGLEFIAVDSNLPDYLEWGHQKIHSIVGAAGILFLQKKYKRYLYASAGLRYGEAIEYAHSYKDVDIGAYSDPMLLPLLSTESTELVSDGLSHDRVEKTTQIMDYEPVYRYLNVCVSGDDTHENCSTCSKCCRTLMTLNSLGKLDDVSHLFDVPKYKKQAEHTYMCRQVYKQNKDPFARSNVELAEANNVSLPGKSQAAIVTMLYRSKKRVGKSMSEERKARIKKLIGR
jgi:hypothetical protein